MTATQDLRDAFAPYFVDDDGSLDALLSGMAVGMEPVDLVVRDSDAWPGWAIMLDANRAPDWALRWLGQLVGVRVAPTTLPAVARAAILAHTRWRRGTVGAIVADVAPLLTGTRTVIVLERQPGAWPAADNPYHYTVRTFTDETPNPAAVAAAVAAQKPAGMIALVQQVARNSYATQEAAHATYADAEAAFTTYADAEAGL